jgi:hypothetical protein
MPRFLLLAVAVAAAAAAPCDATIPGRWLHQAEAMALRWTAAGGRAFSAVLPDGRYTTATLYDNFPDINIFNLHYTIVGPIWAWR